MMFLRILITAIVLFPISGVVQAGIWDNIQNYFRRPEAVAPPMVRVLILHDKPGAVVEVQGRYQIFDPYEGSHISSRLAGKRNFIQTMSGGLKWGEEFPGIHQISIVPDSLQTPVLIDGVQYRGTLYIYDVGGTISIVNEVLLEDYLDLIMAKSFPNRMPEEALAAVAITLRTNALYQIQNPRNKYWDVDATQVGFQGYLETDPDAPTTIAIRDTRNMVMSTTGIYEKMMTPIPAQWNGITVGKGTNEKTVLSKISVDDASLLAKQGEHAAQILAKAFPGTTIQLLQPSVASR